MTGVEILQGDCMDVLPTLPERSVHCVVTSPPYWGLRDYGAPGQLGLEPTPEEYVERMVAVFREVRRVLRDDGTCWLNLGDSYASNWPCNRRSEMGTGSLANGKREARPPRLGGDLKEKDLVGIPWAIAFSLRADGWYLRADCIWSKPNPMPESVTDRPTKSHEYVFLLSKRPSYYYDADAIREDGAGRLDYGDMNIRARLDSGAPWLNGHRDSAGRNKRSVWEIATQPFPEAHFATFPEALVRPCVQAGTSERGCCPECGAPWQRVVKPEGGAIGKAWNDHDGDLQKGNRAINVAKGGNGYHRKDLGWRPACEHEAEPVPCVVLDPFAGAGTTGVVTRKAGRRAVLIELSPDYCAMMRERMRQGMLI